MDRRWELLEGGKRDRKLMIMIWNDLFVVIFVELVIPDVVMYLNSASMRVVSTRQITRQV